MYTVCKNIKRLRMERNMSQKELSEALDISPKTVSKWETEAGLPELQYIVPLARLLGVTTNDLLMPPAASASRPAPLDSAEKYPRIRAYGISAETISAASGTDVETVERVLNGGTLPDDKNAAYRLENILEFLDKLIPKTLESSADMRFFINVLISKLYAWNSISYESLEKCAGLKSGDIESRTRLGYELPAEQKSRLIIALFSLDHILNRSRPYPWDKGISAPHLPGGDAPQPIYILPEHLRTSDGTLKAVSIPPALEHSICGYDAPVLFWRLSKSHWEHGKPFMDIRFAATEDGVETDFSFAIPSREGSLTMDRDVVQQKIRLTAAIPPPERIPEYAIPESPIIEERAENGKLIGCRYNEGSYGYGHLENMLFWKLTEQERTGNKEHIAKVAYMPFTPDPSGKIKYDEDIPITEPEGYIFLEREIAFAIVGSKEFLAFLG